MGATREKKPSKRSQKIQRECTNLAKSSGRQDYLEVPSTSASSVRSGSRSSSKSPSMSSSKSLRSSDSSHDLPPFAIEELPGRGLGMIATRKIRAGELVLAEVPLIRLTHAEEDGLSRDDESVKEPVFDQHFKQLTDGEHHTFRHLHNTRKQNFSKQRSIYYSNCYDLKSPISQDGGSCIGLQAARINHSCVPNVQFSFVEASYVQEFLSTVSDAQANPSSVGSCSNTPQSKGLMVFHAIKDISPKKEILANYESIYLLCDQRNNEMLMHYGFRCTCQSCANEGHFEQSDERRRQMIGLRARVRECERRWQECRKNRANEVGRSTLPHLDADSPTISLDPWMRSPEAQSDAASAMTMLKRLADLLIKEGLSGKELALIYKNLVKWSLRTNDNATVRRWIGKERETCIMCFGQKSERVGEIDRRSDDWWSR